VSQNLNSEIERQVAAAMAAIAVGS
jgi:hypothetical protein